MTAPIRLTVASLETQSPSLRRLQGDTQPACELKLLLSEEQALAVEDRCRLELLLDPHCTNQSSPGYHIKSLYCDTPEWDVFHRRNRFRLFKFRVRQYGSSTQVYLERKSKKGIEVRKKRWCIPLQQLGLLNGDAEQDWEGSWFHNQLIRNRLGPVCLIEYERVAYYGSSGSEPVRLTFDRHIRGGLHHPWSMTSQTFSMPILRNQVVCEFKFRGLLPPLFKSIIHELQLTTSGVSKYRHCIDASGVLKQEQKNYA
ncbi:MAG: polyphosphate polymerase domain-containing protein [Planctomycetia bacterium]|nr:polyphosphate polymerase domain-containing protein [Planctomycetia bacterium]